MNIEVYKKMAENENEYWWFVSRRNIIKNTIEKLNLKTDKILEIGSGTGGNIDMLKSMGKLSLIECNPYAIELTDKVHGIKPIEACFPTDKIKEKFDLIVLLDVLEHIPDDIGTLKSIKELLSEDGSLLITVPAYQWLWSNHDEIHQHKRRYTKTNLEKIVGDDYNIKYSSYMNFLLSPLIMGVRGIEKLFSKKKDSNSEEEVLSKSFLDPLFQKIFSLEQYLIPKIALPFGISIIIILEAKND